MQKLKNTFLLHILKKFLYLLLVVSMLFILSGCGGLSYDEPSSVVEEYTAAIQQLCDDYGLDNAEIEVERNLSGEKIDGTLYYIGISNVTSKKFSQLSGSKSIFIYERI